MDRKKNILFIKDERSEFDAYTPMFAMLFNQVDRVADNDTAMKLFEKHTYDVVISDLSVEPEKAGVLKAMIDRNIDQVIFAMVSPKDTKKLFGIADMGINAFELTPEQFNEALKMIAEFKPRNKVNNTEHSNG